jgi:transcription antitermination factor NusG
VLNAHLRVQPFPFLPEGQKVRISHGVLAGVEATVMNCKQYLRLVLSITLLQRSVLIEVDRDRVRVEHAEQSFKLAA